MSEIDHATLEARLARVAWGRLREASIAVAGCASPEEAAERVVARGLVPLDWFAGDARDYTPSGRKRNPFVPPRVSDVALVAAAHETMLQCEALGREAYARWGGHDDRPRWMVVPGRFTASDGTACVYGLFASATYALDELAACSFDGASFLNSGGHGPRWDATPKPTTLAAASVLSLRTAWRALRREAPSPADPIIEMYALGAAFCLDALGFEILLAEPEYPLLACVRCKRVEPYDPGAVAGETRRECPACGLFCRECFDGPPEAPCPICGAAAAHRRVGPPRG